MTRALLSLLTALAALLAGDVSTQPVAPGATIETLTLAGGLHFRIITNVPLASGSATVDRAVVVIHGTLRNAGDYYNRMTEAASKAGLGAKVAVIAPWFDASGWSNAAWKQGGNSRNGAISSFAVADEILALLADQHRFPNLKRISLAGHSAGAQFAQRYAAFGRPPSRLPVHYVVMNPSSFVWLDATRPAPTTGCASSFNRYKYGLDSRTGYVGPLTSAQVIARYNARTVTVANGDEDTVDNGDLDDTCPANAQGASRLARGAAFTDRFPAPHHDYLIIPGVAHDSGLMFADRRMWPALFGTS